VSSASCGCATELATARASGRERAQQRGRGHGGDEHHDHAGTEHLLAQDSAGQADGGEDDADLPTRGHADTDQQPVLLDHQATGQLASHGDGRQDHAVDEHLRVQEDGRVHDGASVDEEHGAEASDQVVDEVLHRVRGFVLALGLEVDLLQGNAGEVGADDARQPHLQRRGSVQDHGREHDGFTSLLVHLGEQAHDLAGIAVPQQGNHDDEQDRSTQLERELAHGDGLGGVEVGAERQSEEGQDVVDHRGVDDDARELLIDHAQLSQDRGGDAHRRGREDTSEEHSDGPGQSLGEVGEDESADDGHDHADNSDLPAGLGVFEQAVQVGLQADLEQQEHGSDLSQSRDERDAVLAAQLVHEMRLGEHDADQQASDQASEDTWLLQELGKGSQQSGQQHGPSDPQQVVSKFSVHDDSIVCVRLRSTGERLNDFTNNSKGSVCGKKKTTAVVAVGDGCLSRVGDRVVLKQLALLPGGERVEVLDLLLREREVLAPAGVHVDVERGALVRAAVARDVLQDRRGGRHRDEPVEHLADLADLAVAHPALNVHAGRGALPARVRLLVASAQDAALVHEQVVASVVVAAPPQRRRRVRLGVAVHLVAEVFVEQPRSQERVLVEQLARLGVHLVPGLVHVRVHPALDDAGPAVGPAPLPGLASDLDLLGVLHAQGQASPLALAAVRPASVGLAPLGSTVLGQGALELLGRHVFSVG